MFSETPLRLNRLIIGGSILLIFVLASCYAKLQQEHDQTAPGEPSVPSSKCLDCHQYRENHHPVDIAPSDPADFPFPLYDGKITCLTCHVEDHMTGGAKLLRGGPYDDRREICFLCHSEENFLEINPHVMLDKNGKVLEVDGKPVCLLCHAVKPDPDKDRTEDVRFRADVAFLCWRCHPPMAPPQFFSKHFLAKPSPSMLRFIERKEREMQVTIPLVPRERITCSTCHNPHQKGVIKFGPSAKGANSQGKLRLQSPTLCFVCHNMS